MFNCNVGYMFTMNMSYSWISLRFLVQMTREVGHF